MPPRGIGWDCTAVECSPLAQGSKCSGAKGKESNNKITGFVTPQIYREANSLYLWAHEVARVRRGVWGKQQRLQSDVNPPRLWHKGRELLPLVTILFDHTCPWKGSTTFSKPLAHSLSLSLLIRSRHQHQMKKTREHLRAKTLLNTSTDSSSILLFVVTIGM